MPGARRRAGHHLSRQPDGPRRSRRRGARWASTPRPRPRRPPGPRPRRRPPGPRPRRRRRCPATRRRRRARRRPTRSQAPTTALPTYQPTTPQPTTQQRRRHDHGHTDDRSTDRRSQLRKSQSCRRRRATADDVAHNAGAVARPPHSRREHGADAGPDPHSDHRRAPATRSPRAATRKTRSMGCWARPPAPQTCWAGYRELRQVGTSVGPEKPWRTEGHPSMIACRFCYLDLWRERREDGPM